MPNTLTSLIPTFYAALDTVSREMVGFIPSVLRDATVTRAAKDQVIRSFATRAASAVDIAPGVTAPNDGDQTIDSVTLTISKSRAVPIRWNGEEELALASPGGITMQRILQDQIAQAMRRLCNEIEADLGICAYQNASRAVGTVGTNPFVVGSNKVIDNIADVRQVLTDNGAPLSDLQLVVDTAAGAGLRKVPNIYRVNEAGDESLLRQGVLSDLLGFQIRESAGIATPAVGSITATVNNAGYAVGSTSITLTSAAVALLKGDVIAIQDDPHRYVVAESLSGTGGVLKIAEPGLRQAIPAATKTITVLASGPRNVAFHRNALVLVTRAPAVPSGGDMADDATVLQDERSGLAFDVRAYRQYRQVRYEVAIAWGVACVKPAHVAILLG